MGSGTSLEAEGSFSIIFVGARTEAMNSIWALTRIGEVCWANTGRYGFSTGCHLASAGAGWVLSFKFSLLESVEARADALKVSNSLGNDFVL